MTDFTLSERELAQWLNKHPDRRVFRNRDYTDSECIGILLGEIFVILFFFIVLKVVKL